MLCATYAPDTAADVSCTAPASMMMTRHSTCIEEVAKTVPPFYAVRSGKHTYEARGTGPDYDFTPHNPSIDLLVADIIELSELTAGDWDGEGADPISSASVKDAVRMLNLIKAIGVTVGENVTVTPDVDGTIMLEVVQNPYSTLKFMGNGRVAFAPGNGQAGWRSVDLSTAVDFRNLLA